VAFSKPELLMERRDWMWTMDEFLQKVGSIAPTLLFPDAVARRDGERDGMRRRRRPVAAGAQPCEGFLGLLGTNLSASSAPTTRRLARGPAGWRSGHTSSDRDGAFSVTSMDFSRTRAGRSAAQGEGSLIGEAR
jgi:hypothetical protein